VSEFKAIGNALLKFIAGILSESDGSPSSTRTLMYIFSFFSMWLIWRLFYHIIRIQDAATLSIWLSNMPLLITTLIGLISLPYAVNRGTSTLSDLAGMIAAVQAKSKSAASE
jgi:hypothetical protein